MSNFIINKSSDLSFALVGGKEQLLSSSELIQFTIGGK